MKRTLAEHVAFLMLSAALAVGAWAVTGRAACSVTAPYQFPVQPGTPEWVELSANARRAACRLPAGLAEQMTSEALLETGEDPLRGVYLETFCAWLPELSRMAGV